MTSRYRGGLRQMGQCDAVSVNFALPPFNQKDSVPIIALL
jgi:hypothetical protein